MPAFFLIIIITISNINTRAIKIAGVAIENSILVLDMVLVRYGARVVPADEAKKTMFKRVPLPFL